ncbi:hypothetical protein ABW19_dt0208183 [Dactylella cylindrospora]|nr:hypothetical protein ABW19_dt0208183 [Dactylella cylindrospora]
MADVAGILFQDHDYVRPSTVPSPPGNLTVHIYHVNIPCGDCSIHLLVDTTGANNNNGKTFLGTILRAVLMDGGRNTSGILAARMILEKIMIIADMYKQPPLQGEKIPDAHKNLPSRIRFDSWVITHWDADHYIGSLEFLLDDVMTLNAAAGYLNNPAKIASGAKMKFTGCSYMKYSTSDAPLTNVYCPNWEHGPKKGKEYEWKGHHWQMEVGDKQLKGNLNFLIQAEVGKNAFLQKKGKNTKWVQSPSIAKLVLSGPSNLVGRDFFSGAQATVDRKTCPSLLALRDSTIQAKTSNKDHPLLLCVGAYGALVGHQDEPIKKPPEGTIDNFVSIQAFLMWPRLNSDISFYCGGDAHAGTEGMLAKYIQNGNWRILTMKASHHGARTSTHPLLLQVGNPAKVIISAGEEYGHPKDNELLDEMNTSIWNSSNAEIKELLTYIEEAGSRWLTNIHMEEEFKICNIIQNQIIAAAKPGGGTPDWSDLVARFQNLTIPPHWVIVYCKQLEGLTILTEELRKLVIQSLLTAATQVWWRSLALRGPDAQKEEDYIFMDLSDQGCAVRYPDECAGFSLCETVYVEKTKTIKVLQNLGIQSYPDQEEAKQIRLEQEQWGVYKQQKKIPEQITLSEIIGKRGQSSMNQYERAREKAEGLTDDAMKAAKKRKKLKTTPQDKATVINFYNQQINDLDTYVENETYTLGVSTSEFAEMMAQQSAWLQNLRAMAPKIDYSSLQNTSFNLNLQSNFLSNDTQSGIALGQLSDGEMTGLQSHLILSKTISSEIAAFEAPEILMQVAMPDPANNGGQIATPAQGNAALILGSLTIAPAEGNLTLSEVPGQGQNPVALGIMPSKIVFFLNKLPSRTINWTDSKIAISVPDSKDTSCSYEVPLDSESNLGGWFIVVFGPCTTKIQGTITVDQLIVTDTPNVPIKPGLIVPTIDTVSITLGLGLSFTTELVVIQKQFGNSFTEDGCNVYLRELVLGLDTRMPPVDISLKDFLAICGVTISDWLATSLNDIKLKPRSVTDPTSQRNAIWFWPEDSMAAMIRLEMVPDTTEGLLAFLKDYLPTLQITELLDEVYLIGKSTTKLSSRSETSFSTATAGEAIFVLDKTKDQGYLAAFSMGHAGVKINVQFNNANVSPLDSVCNWLNAYLSSLKADSSCLIPDLGSYLTDLFNVNTKKSSDGGAAFLLREISAITSGQSLSKFEVAFEMDLPFGCPSDSHVAFLLKYRWIKGTHHFEGRLWTPADVSAYTMLPDYEAIYNLQPLRPSTVASEISLYYLDPNHPLDQSAIPNFLPNAISKLLLTFDMSPKSSQIHLDGVLTCTTASGKVPMIQLSELSFSMDYTLPKKGQPSAFSFMLTGDVDLFTRENTTKTQADATIAATISYNQGLWEFNADAQDIQMSSLYTLFGGDSNASDVMDILEKITIVNLSLDYTFISGEASQLSVSTNIDVAGFMLSLSYNHHGQDDWTVQAGGSVTLLPPGENSVTVGSIIDSLTDSSSFGLPQFLTDVEITFPEGVTAALGFDCSKIAIKPNQPAICFSAYGIFAGISFTFLQLKYPASNGKPGSIKRVIKASLQTMPDITIPLIGKLKQPFDELYFMWVQDNSTVATPDQKGLNQYDVQQLNQQIATSNKSLPKGVTALEPLLFKANGSTGLQNKSAQQQAADNVDAKIVIQAGWHFVITRNDDMGVPQVVVDYVFGNKQNQPNTSSMQNTTNAPEGDAKASAVVPKGNPQDPNAASGEGKTHVESFKKSQGPLTFRNIGFQYKDDTLYLVMDASVLLGPIELDLLGFKLGLDLKTFNISNFIDTIGESIKVSLEGLAVSFDKPPTSIAGIFRHTVTDDLDAYSGGVIIKMEPWSFQAAGFYGTSRGETCVFLFLKLDGPILSLGFADISGITGGFGYNVDIRYPSVEEVPSFPFVANNTSGGTPSQQLIALTDPGAGGWISVKPGTMWLAAGLKVTAFKVLSVDAVAIFQWEPSIKLAIFGMATCDAPSAKATFRFAHVEMGILAVLDPMAGLFKVEAQLAPTSFILHPDCHLTGGFALYSWWDPGPTGVASHQGEGDWVFSMGGYHRSFKKPPYYPNPERLKISWSLGGTLSITGEAYFAVTPKVCMGGGHLYASMSVGPLSAWFDASVDFLLNYDPFYVTADASVSVGVAFTLDLLLVTLHIHTEIGATLHIEGPPIHGYVHVDFWVFGFDIKFGDSDSLPSKLYLPDFYKSVLQLDNQMQGSSQPAEQPPHLFSCILGLIPPASSTVPEASAEWRIRPGKFSFSVVCRFPITSATVDGVDVLLTGDAPMYSKPMQIEQTLKSSVTIVIKQIFDDGKAEQVVTQWQTKGQQKNVPKALFEKYDSNDDPMVKGNGITDLLNGGDVSLSLTSSVLITAPPTKPSDDKIQKFNSTEGVLAEVYDKDVQKQFPPFEKATSSWAPATIKDIADPSDWDAVSAAWKKPRDPTELTTIVNYWSDTLLWNAGVEKDKQVVLNATAPEFLLDNFDDLYIDPPHIIVQ